jgi:hypothetical protein
VGMANSVQASRVEEATNLYAISDTCTIAIRESLLCDELDGLSDHWTFLKTTGRRLCGGKPRLRPLAAALRLWAPTARNPATVAGSAGSATCLCAVHQASKTAQSSA